jgi:hypothetical protein
MEDFSLVVIEAGGARIAEWEDGKRLESLSITLQVGGDLRVKYLLLLVIRPC